MAYQNTENLIQAISERFKADPEMVRQIFFTALRAFLYKEQLRHKKDVNQLMDDDQKLASYGVELIRLPVDFWIDPP